ncbi:hypothetical protein DB30_05601 [Enhygromyxa salina]|uniref:Uncharacterized protein n=1 Tax=Enhygromyxa salina TaxID=215803 RepID=A0A0C2D0M7_9BACT|nr:hypothetical protein DB30_05601 [Enhygromyxa salina]
MFSARARASRPLADALSQAYWGEFAVDRGPVHSPELNPQL